MNRQDEDQVDEDEEEANDAPEPAEEARGAAHEESEPVNEADYGKWKMDRFKNYCRDILVTQPKPEERT